MVYETERDIRIRTEYSVRAADTARRRVTEVMNECDRPYGANNPWRTTILPGMDKMMRFAWRPVYDPPRNIPVWSLRGYIGNWTADELLHMIQFYATYAAQIDLWEREIHDITYEQVDEYSASEKFLEQYGEVFGKPQILRYRHTCPECIPLMKNGKWDIYVCKDHMGRSGGYSYSMVLRACHQSQLDIVTNLQYDYVRQRLQMRQHGQRDVDQDGTPNDGSQFQRVITSAHMFIYYNRERFKYVWGEDKWETCMAAERVGVSRRRPLRDTPEPPTEDDFQRENEEFEANRREPDPQDDERE